MSRLTLRPAMTALALSLAALGGSTLMPGEASAKGFHGGWGHGHHGGHGGWHGGWRHRYHGPTFVSYGAYPVAYGGCYTKRFVRFDGAIVIKKRCY